ncbi:MULTISPECIES: NACHT domain-containing NTPase [unclassified Nostoc]|uniref:NACHT domain-containing protein n=1 Tax=unclassified Nostoc TaxID=2593658 RepID=UPI001D977697|nr:NACHT domain-containing NTPase [Nostoc sp. JL23]MBN3879504.1 NACHT domain-containing NTPase [Nostoc sp. JL23]
MSGRSLFSSPEGIQKAKRALIRYSLTQKALAKELEVTRQPIGKFLTGKPVDRNLFVQICDRLDLEWEEVVVNEPTSEPEVSQDNSIDIDAIVQEVREKIKPLIQDCGTMRVLDTPQPIGLNDIYTSVNILEKITGQRRLRIDELLEQSSSQDFDLFGLNRITEKRVPGLQVVEKHSKLMILGKPGAGKTTFLKYLAIQCIGGEFQAERVPIFVTLKNFAEAANKPGLLQHITEETRNLISSIQDVLSYGKALVLLDGLDEVREEDSNRILKEIREFSDRFPNNQFVMTCRIAAREYIFDKFTEVEVADFDDDQISNFTNKWFKDKAVKPETFIKRLEENSRIKQLAASPLLLTLLCLVFEESGDFPANRSELYKEGLDTLLKKWDAKRGIQRDQIYKKLSVQRKEDLLSKIALTTFERGDYFFKAKIAEQYITEYISYLPDANTDEQALQFDSEQVLRSIEHHHGLVVARAERIYSFSHLTFHEYFTAREFVVVRQSSEEALQNLVSHITEKRWREVFLLAVEMSSSADRLLLLIKDKIDFMVAGDQRLQEFLLWVKEKSLPVKVSCKPAAVRAFYLSLFQSLFRSLALSLSLSCSLDLDLSRSLDLDLDLSLSLSLNLSFSLFLSRSLSLDLDVSLSLDLDLSRSLDLSLDPELKNLLQKLREQLPSRQDRQVSQKWWLVNGKTWCEELREVMIKYRNIGHDWQFSNEQKELLQKYYDANKLLVDCLNSDCYVSREVRQQIEDTLLLPIAEIKQRQQQF